MWIKGDSAIAEHAGLLSFITWFLLGMFECFVSVHHMCWLQKPEVGTRSSGPLVTDDCEPP